MKYLKLLLWPFSLLFGGIMLLRNYLYDTKVLRSTRFGLPVIAVGNLTVGGTGKTPHVEYLLRLLRGNETATLSRGYKRQSKGFVLADHTASAAMLGDEPFQYHRDFQDVTVAVSEDRVAGIAKLLDLKPGLEVVVLDDAMQHRPVQPSLNILLTDYTRPFNKDLVLPAGLLREPRQGAKRADVVVVSKCPAALKLEEELAIRKQISRYSRPGAPVFFSTFRYGAPLSIGSSDSISKRIILLTGIANAAPLVHFLEEEQYVIHRHVSFDDHHHYTRLNLLQLRELLHAEQAGNLSVLTTRKDAVKLQEGGLQEITRQLPLFYIPIEVAFLKDGERFDALVLEHVASFRKQ